MNLTAVKNINKQLKKMTEIWNERNLKAPALKTCIVNGDIELRQGKNHPSHINSMKKYQNFFQTSSNYEQSWKNLIFTSKTEMNSKCRLLIVPD